MQDVIYSKVRGLDDQYELFLNGEKVGTVSRKTFTVPAKRPGTTRRVTEYDFFPSVEFLPQCTCVTMKKLKDIIADYDVKLMSPRQERSAA